MAELGLANGDNLRNSFPVVTGNSPDVIPPTGTSQGYTRGPGRSSKPSVSTPVTRPVTPFLLGLSPQFGYDGEILSTGLFYRGRTLLAVTIVVHTDVTCRKVALPCQ